MPTITVFGNSEALPATASYAEGVRFGRRLAEAGYRVTQATGSRDLDAVGATKEPDGHGGGRYRLAAAPDDGPAR